MLTDTGRTERWTRRRFFVSFTAACSNILSACGGAGSPSSVASTRVTRKLRGLESVLAAYATSGEKGCARAALNALIEEEASEEEVEGEDEWSKFCGLYSTLNPVFVVADHRTGSSP